MSNAHFGVVILMMIGIVIYVVVSINTGLENRTKNYEKIDHATNCIELQTFYQQALEFESHYNDNGESDTVTQHQQTKATELKCP